ncbi:fasciclin domain-containing protein [Mycobacterium barrassiae]|uniref:fasciclin domain-containing protein n=1 Tax=Mycobacterium barrassiae TaxID=319709 RepID=UPI0022658EB0|nr:fasciclin domain-containing protein [Mycobacterium barrassiae]MCV7301556.1 fasciclin domain-containing protein [Mycobacterium barrassiae]
MKTRTSKAIGAAAGIAAIALSVPLAVTAYAEPTEAPTLEIPDPQGPGCDEFKTEVPNYKSLANSPVGAALQSIPEASTFYSAISGGFNPAVNIVPVLENGPYVVFAPTNEAFAALPPAQLDALKADPAALSDLVYYHEFLGLLGNEDVKGQRPTQQGAEINVEGEGGDITVNDAKLVCGAIFAKNARIYLIDTVLDPKSPPEPLTPSSTSTTSTTTTTTSETTPTETPAAEAPASVASVAPSSEPEPMPAADAPIG